MARATFVKAAQKDIYERGKNVQYVSEKGKRKGQTLTKRDRTIPENENDKIFIAKGESYYWWAFKNGGKHLSKTKPKASQLTQSNYLSQLYAMQESIDEFSPETVDDLQSFLEDLLGQVENLKDETQGSLNNMPEGLQQGDTGQLLQERIDALENAQSELEAIDTDYDEMDEQELKEEVAEENDIDTESDDWESQLTDEMIEEKRNEKAQEWLDEKMAELGGVSFE